MFERLSKCFSYASPVTKKSNSKQQSRKCWRKDCETCLCLFVRATQILSLGLVEMVNEKRCSRNSCLNYDFVQMKNVAPVKLALSFVMMLFTTIVSVATFWLVEKQFSIFGISYFNSSDFLTMSIFTTTAFLIVIRTWRCRVRYLQFVQLVLSNLFELPAIYCLPNQTQEELIFTDDRTVPSCSNTPHVLEPDYSIMTFTMIAVKDHHWHSTMNLQFRSIILALCYTAFCGYYLIGGSYHILTATSSSHGFLFYGFIILGFCAQGFFFVLYPLAGYSYTCLCLVLYIQSEHLNQFIRRIRERTRETHQLPLKEELDLIRVWYSRVARSVLNFDRFGHPIFFALYTGQTVAMFIKALDLVFKLRTFTVERYLHFVALGLYCFAIIHLLQTVNQLNRSIKKPGQYMSEIGMHSTVNEPYAFSEYLCVMEHRFAHRHCQLTFLRTTQIGKEFFIITIVLIFTAVAPFGSFGHLLIEITHRMHFLI